MTLNQIDSHDPDLSDAHPIPDQISLSNQVKICLQEGEVDMTMQGGDFTKLFDSSLHSLDLSLWPKALRYSEKLGFATKHHFS
jgi:intraflagellar transport protein 52